MELNTVERAIKTEIDTRKDRNRHKNRIKRSGQAQFMSKASTITSPPCEDEPVGTIGAWTELLHTRSCHKMMC